MPSATLCHFVARLADSARSSLANGRPWSDLINRPTFSRLDSIFDATSRIHKNLAYFRINYVSRAVVSALSDLFAHGLEAWNSWYAEIALK